MARVKLGIERSVPDNYPSQRFRKRERKLIEAIQKDVNINETFECPLTWSAIERSSNDLFDGTLAAGDELTFRTDKNTFVAHVQSVNGTVANVFPYVSASGLEIPTDANATDGVLGWEIASDILATDKMVYTVGSTGKTIYAEATITIDDVSNSTKTAFGWRKVQAFDSDIANYTDFAVLIKDGSENIDIDHDLNDGGTATSTDTTLNWADGESYVLRVEVNKDGVAKFLVNGTEYQSSTGFTFDSGDNIMPFLFHIAETGDAGLSVANLEIGYV